jgi:hypothetical protein
MIAKEALIADEFKVEVLRVLIFEVAATRVLQLIFDELIVDIDAVFPVNVETCATLMFAFLAFIVEQLIVLDDAVELLTTSMFAKSPAYVIEYVPNVVINVAPSEQVLIDDVLIAFAVILETLIFTGLKTSAVKLVNEPLTTLKLSALTLFTLTVVVV